MASYGRKDDGKYSPRVWSKRSNSISPSPTRQSVGSLASYAEGGAESFEKRKNKQRKRSRWHVLRRRLTRKGVVPVNKDHVRYKLLSCIREGLRQVVRENPNIVPKRALATDDFSEVIRVHAKLEEQEFEFENFAPSVFATMRHAIGMDEQEYMSSVAPTNLPYLEFISNSKSGQDFFLTHDMQIMFKSNRQRDTKFFLSMLPDYLQHFIHYPHSLLVKYIGCYAIQPKGRPKKYYLVMQSIFYPAERIEDRFDVKGCTAGRYQKPPDPNSHVITVLKDQNFVKQDLDLDFGDQGEWFKEQIKADSEFLSNLNCMDYSLLIGRQKKHVDERKTEGVPDVVDRIGKSISPTRKCKVSPGAEGSDEILTAEPEDNFSNNNSNVIVFSTTSLRSGRESSTTQDIPGVVNGETVSQISATVILPQVKPGVMFPRSLIDGVEKFKEEHRRLLPKCRNGLHIIDGEDYRYFLGIVDFLTRFDMRQKLAQYWKIIKYCCGPHSTKRPDFYRDRFVRFLSDKVRHKT